MPSTNHYFRTIGVRCAAPTSRIVTLIGDGCFQHQPGFLSTLAGLVATEKFSREVIIFVLVNEVYAIDQVSFAPSLIHT